MQLSIWWVQSGAVISIGGINPFTLNWGQVRDIASFLPLYWSVTSLRRVGEETTFNSFPACQQSWAVTLFDNETITLLGWSLFPTAFLIGIQRQCCHFPPHPPLLCRYGLAFLPVVHKSNQRYCHIQSYTADVCEIWSLRLTLSVRSRGQTLCPVA